MYNSLVVYGDFINKTKNKLFRLGNVRVQVLQQ